MSSPFANPAATDHPLADAIWTALRQVPDPELGVSIVDLGLIRRVELEPGVVLVEMTMTSPACPLGALLLEEVEQAAQSVVPLQLRVDVALLWDPPWTPAWMSDEARAQLGWPDPKE